MKLSKAILSTAIAAALISTASAADNTATIDITGATAFRASTHSSILAVLTGETYAYTGATLSGAQQAIFKGNLGSTAVIVRTSFNGSAEGVGALANGTNVNFLSTVEATVPTSSGGTGSTAVGTDAASADLALSDVFQASTEYKTPGLFGSIVAIVPFKFVASEGGFADGLTNMTPQIFRVLYSNGTIPLSIISGDAADEATLVYAAGRDSGSGTRITALAETGYGITQQVSQFTGTVTSGVVTALNFVGNGGYPSGGNLATLLGGQAFASQGGYIVGYVGLPDAATAVTNGAADMTYNGVSYTADNVYNGKYTFWGYEHLYSKTANPGNNVGTLRDALVTEIGNTPGAAGLDPDFMRVSRETDGANVVATF